jgi:predicted transcriptional regulator
LIQNSEGLPLERTRLIWENNIKIDLKGMLLKCMNRNYLVQDQTMDHDNEFFGSIKGSKFLD